MQAVMSVLLTAFSQIYRKNWEQKTEQKDLKNLPFGQKKSPFKVGPWKV
jgi:hypothetical protein